MSSIVTAIFDVFTDIGEWIATAFQSLSAMFYTTEGGLTLIGVLAICGLGVSIIMMLINVIRSFLRFE